MGVLGLGKRWLDVYVGVVQQGDRRCNWTWKRMMEMTEKAGTKRVVCEKCQGLGTVTHTFTGFVNGEMETVAVKVKCRACRGQGVVLIKPESTE